MLYISICFLVYLIILGLLVNVVRLLIPPILPMTLIQRDCPCIEPLKSSFRKTRIIYPWVSRLDCIASVYHANQYFEILSCGEWICRYAFPHADAPNRLFVAIHFLWCYPRTGHRSFNHHCSCGRLRSATS